MSSSRSISPSKSSNDSIKLFIDEEDKTREALNTFKPLEENQYANKKLGNAKHNEFMECDCYEEFEDGVNHACDENSDCINRLTLIECVNGLCGSCGDDCQNQRFQKRQYADIAVFQTKLKGYGVRAQTNIEAHDFIYEYMGEVIPEDVFRDRLVDYDQKGYKHFYFMMLQNGEFIDATIKGSLARFCNHSCNPNAYVNKWVVGGKLKMGIFANRKILRGEEITFDYNVDRYGATAQKCYCEEPNCIGFLGGKTQTDAASLLPQNMAEALVVSVTMEKQWIKLKKLQGEKITKSEGNNINVEFVTSLNPPPCERTEDVIKVMSVLLQVEDPLLAEKLLQRLFNIEPNSNLHHQILKLHGYTCFVKLLQLFGDDIAMEFKILDFLLELPKTTKNGVISSQIDKQVELLGKSNKKLEAKCNKLLQKWNDFETYKRISKKDIKEVSNKMVDLRRIRLPPGWEIVHENGKPMYYNAQQKTKLHQPPSGSSKTFNSTRGQIDANSSIASKPPILKRARLDDEEYEKQKLRRIEKEKEAIEKVKEEETKALKMKLEMENQRKNELERIIAEANKQKDMERVHLAQVEREKEEKNLKKKNHYLEHKWDKFFASVVPSLLRKYEQKEGLSHDHAKQCARDIVKILTSKELKKDVKRPPPEELSKDKRTKVKQFTASYMDKFLIKYRKKHNS